MFGEQRTPPPPGLPGMNTPNPFGSHHAQAHDEAAIELARMMSAAQRYAQLTASQAQQHAVPVHAPAARQPQVQQSVPLPAAAEPPPPPPAAPEQPKPRASRKSAAGEEHGGSSLWTYLLVAALFAAAGYKCGHDWHAPQKQPPASASPSRELQSHQLSR